MVHWKKQEGASLTPQLLFLLSGSVCVCGGGGGGLVLPRNVNGRLSC